MRKQMKVSDMRELSELTHISLFAGIAGIDLAAEWAGFRTILFVEKDSYCQKVLKKHWPDVPIIGDIKDVKGKEWSATLITGGFPCQPVSAAGKRRGKEDDRWLWPEMLGVIRKVRPTWVVAENVAGLLRMGLNDCISDLEDIGYKVQSFLIPACAVNAPHRRDRIFIVGYSEHAGYNAPEIRRSIEEGGDNSQTGEKQTSKLEGSSEQCETVANYEGSRQRPQFNKVTDKLLSENRSSQKPESGSGDVSDSEGAGLERSDATRSAQLGGCPAEYFGGDWWAVEPELGRVAYGIPHRVDRLRCLGNAVVPQQIYPILKAIADIERGQA